MRAFVLLVSLPLLVACAADGDPASPREVISDRGGEKIVLDNGVCIRIDSTGDEDLVTRVAPGICQQT